MSHYYIYDPNLKSDKNEIRYTFRGKELVLFSDSGIFSRERVDFGTNVLLNSLCDLDDVQSILDVGCGYGIIGIALSKKYPNKNITMIDINKACVDATKENIKKNGIKNAIVLESNIYENVDEAFDMIISNPPIRAGKLVVHEIIEGGYNHLNKNGFIIVVIQKKQGAETLFKKMNDVFGNAEIVNKEKGYYIIKSIK